MQISRSLGVTSLKMKRPRRNGGGVMFTGTLIDELISSVEHAEKQAHKTADSPETNLTYWYTAIEREPVFDSKLLGVA